MAITLSDGVTTLDLHPDLYWVDEFEWQPVEQSAERTITGAVVLNTATRIAGRNITLAPVDDSSAWMSRTIVEALNAWANVAGKQLVLTIRGTSYDVVFRHQDSPALDIKPVVHYNDTNGSDWYYATIRFMEI